MKRTIILFALTIVACDHGDDFDPDLACSEASATPVLNKSVRANDVVIDIMSTGYGIVVLQDPALTEAACEIEESDPLIMTCHFACDLDMTAAMEWPTDPGTYSVIMRNPCG